MPKQVYVLRADLVGFPRVNRTIAVRSDQTFVELHYALQGGFWAQDGSEYTHSFHAAQPSPLGPLARAPAPRSAEICLDRLRLKKGQRIAYLFDFGDERRVRLILREITADDGQLYPRLLDSDGHAPPQYPTCDDFEDVA